MSKYEPKSIQLPLAKMAGCPWNLLDATGKRIAWAGGPDCTEAEQIAYANDLLNIVAMYEALSDLVEEAHPKILKLEAEVERLRKLVEELGGEV